MFIWLGVERSGPQTANDLAAEVRETAHEVVDGQKNDTMEGMEGVPGATNVEDVRNTVQHTRVRVIDSA